MIINYNFPGVVGRGQVVGRENGYFSGENTNLFRNVKASNILNT